MISLIDFEKDLIIPKEEAEKLGLRYKKDIRIGINDSKLKKMESYNYYVDECIEKDGKYYRNKKKLEDGDSESDYYLYVKYTGTIDYVCVTKDNNLVNLFVFAPICKHKFYVRESVISKEASIDSVEMILHRLEDKSTMLEGLVDKVKNNTFNKKTNVHVGGGLITTYNDLLLKEDVCTDELQAELNNGWRIIAVCVQADQRRPDYILGRYNPTLEVYANPNAKR